MSNAKQRTMKLYHGSHREISEIDKNRAMYFTTDIKVAKEYALGLDDCGNFNEESFIYAIDVNKDDFTLIEDFLEFDLIGDLDYDNMPKKCYNQESTYYCIKSVEKLDLFDNYKNKL